MTDYSKAIEKLNNLRDWFAGHQAMIGWSRVLSAEIGNLGLPSRVHLSDTAFFRVASEASAITHHVDSGGGQYTLWLSAMVDGVKVSVSIDRKSFSEIAEIADEIGVEL